MDRTESISLIGMPGAGKSTVGVLLAKQLGRPFVDTDVYIQAGTGRTLQEIIDTDGLEAFTRIEQEYVCCLGPAGHVVATGGSVVYSRPAMEYLADAGPIVYLALRLPDLVRRLDNLQIRGVVMPAGMTLAELYAERRGLYEQWADITIDCRDLSHQATVEAVIAALDNR